MTVDYSQPIEYVGDIAGICSATVSESYHRGRRIVIVDDGDGGLFIRVADQNGTATLLDGDWAGTVRNIPQPPAFHVDAPGQYIQRDGGVATVDKILAAKGERYPVLGRSAANIREMWAEDGKYYVTKDSPLDLIAKAPQSPARIEAPGIIPQRDGRDAWVREIVPLEIEYPVRGVDADGDDAEWTITGQADMERDCDYDLLPESR
jgi:hypothetical protein